MRDVPQALSGQQSQPGYLRDSAGRLPSEQPPWRAARSFTQRPEAGPRCPWMEGTWVWGQQLCFFLPEQAFPILSTRPVRPNGAAASGVFQPMQILFVRNEQKGLGKDSVFP